MLFLGDYTDRGIYGAEVVYTILRLKLANPEKVFLVRGNHEDRVITSTNGFEEECAKKFEKNADAIYQAIHYIYETFPVAIYLGSGPESGKKYYFQCCHGGMEIGFDPKKLLDDSKAHVKILLTTLNRQDAFKALSQDLQQVLSRNLNYFTDNTEDPLFTYIDEEMDCTQFYKINDTLKDIDLEDKTIRQSTSFYGNIGFMWNDFFVSEKGLLVYQDNRGHKFGEKVTKEVLEKTHTKGSEVVGVLRAHQHGDKAMMKAIKDGGGVARLWAQDKQTTVGGLWRGIVCTFSVAPDAGYDIDYDAFGLLTLTNTFDECKLEVFRIEKNKLYAKEKLEIKSQETESAPQTSQPPVEQAPKQIAAQKPTTTSVEAAVIKAKAQPQQQKQPLATSTSLQPQGIFSTIFSTIGSWFVTMGSKIKQAFITVKSFLGF